MNTEARREEFEREFMCDYLGTSLQLKDEFLSRGSDGEYQNFAAKGAWWAWNLSPSKITIDIGPDVQDNTDQPFGQLMCIATNAGLAKCRRNILEAGVKVK